MPVADLSVTKTDAPDPVLRLQTITYTGTVANAGPDAAVNVVFTDPLPPETAFVGGSAPPGWSCTAPPVGSGGAAVCTTASLAAGATAEFTLVVRVRLAAAPGTLIENTGTVASDTHDPTTGNNAATAQTLVTTPTATATPGGPTATPTATATASPTRTATATPAVALSIGDAAAPERDFSARALRFTAALSSPSAAAVRVDYQTAAGTATGGSDCGGGADYRARSGTLFFPAGTLTRPLDVFVCGDRAPEGAETFVVQLSNPVNATLTDAQGTGTIADDD
jgi:uncharacterized repeat protein (TIGR01451 family)